MKNTKKYVKNFTFNSNPGLEQEELKPWQIFSYICQLTGIFILSISIFFENVNKSNITSEDKEQVLQFVFNLVFTTPFNDTSVNENADHLASVFSDLVIYLNILF